MQRRERAAPAHAFTVQAWCPECALGRRKQDTKNGSRGPDALHFFTATRTKLGPQIKMRDRESTRYSDTQTTAASAHVMPHTTANVVLLQVHGEVVLVAFCDASFAGDVERKSQRGRLHYLIHELEGQHPRYARHLMQLIHDERVPPVRGVFSPARNGARGTPTGERLGNSRKAASQRAVGRSSLA